MRHVGIDIGKGKCDYCIIDGVGRVTRRGQYPNTGEGTRAFAAETVAKYGKNGCRAARGTTANMRRTTHNALEREGVHIEPANTYRMSTTSKTAKKTDKVDAEKTAHIMRMDMIPKCRVPRPDVQAVGNTVRERVKTVQGRTRIANRIHSMLDAEGLDKTDGSLHSYPGLKCPDGPKLAAKADTKIPRRRCRPIGTPNAEAKAADADIGEEAADNGYAKILTGTTGAGPLAAPPPAAGMDGIDRFEGPGNLGSWAGPYTRRAPVGRQYIPRQNEKARRGKAGQPDSVRGGQHGRHTRPEDEGGVRGGAQAARRQARTGNCGGGRQNDDNNVAHARDNVPV